MTTKDNGGPAFPSGSMSIGDGDTQAFTSGMTLRDWFAGQALAGAMVSVGKDAGIIHWNELARDCYRAANAMLEERK